MVNPAKKWRIREAIAKQAVATAQTDTQVVEDSESSNTRGQFPLDSNGGGGPTQLDGLNRNAEETQPTDSDEVLSLRQLWNQRNRIFDNSAVPDSEAPSSDPHHNKHTLPGPSHDWRTSIPAEIVVRPVPRPAFASGTVVPDSEPPTSNPNPSISGLSHGRRATIPCDVSESLHPALNTVERSGDSPERGWE